MSGFGLVPVPEDGGDVVQLPPGETVLGRGPFLGIGDTRVSRRHALLQILDGQLRLKPTHVNPCFVLPSSDDDPRPLEIGSWHRLRPGDLFSLLPGRFTYRVEAVGREESSPRNSQNLEEEDGDLPDPARSDGPTSRPNGKKGSIPSGESRQEDSSRRLGGAQSEQTPPPRRRVLPAWMMAAAAAAAPRVQSGVKRRKQAELCEEEEEDRPRKKSRKTSSKEENHATETDVLPEESTSRRPRVGSDHPTMDLEREGKGEGPSQTSEARRSLTEEKSRSRVRTACPYGKNCYRKNPLHFHECSHPGDSDYEEEEEEEDEEDRPECPYGTDCYRKNPLHRKEFRHTQRPARSTRNMTQAPVVEDSSGDDDSFIDDDSEGAGSDSDYAPPGSDGSEREDVQRLQEEAKAFLKKRRR